MWGSSRQLLFTNTIHVILQRHSRLYPIRNENRSIRRRFVHLGLSQRQKVVEKKLQLAIDRIQAFCQQWGFTINKTKTNYTTFTTAGYRSNYARTYLNLQVEDSQIPLEPFPTFLGITLDPKLSFKQHLQNISKKITSKINLIRRFKALKFTNKTKVGLIIYKTLIRSIFDYSFIILNTSTQQISKNLQVI